MVQGERMHDSFVRCLHAWKASMQAIAQRKISARQMSFFLDLAGHSQSYRAIEGALAKKVVKEPIYKPRYKPVQQSIDSREERQIVRWVEAEQLYGISAVDICRRLNQLRASAKRRQVSLTSR
eukprot:6836161-Karenia_brevis.AAC.1